MLTVAELLDASRASHATYRAIARDAERQRRRVAGSARHAHLGDALRARLAAHAADPQHADPAWRDDPVSHDALVAFYRQALNLETPPAAASAPTAPAQAPPTKRRPQARPTRQAKPNRKAAKK